jgi:hypothetical protein
VRLKPGGGPAPGGEVGSNRQYEPTVWPFPTPKESPAQTRKSKRGNPFQKWSQGGSNPRPPACKAYLNTPLFVDFQNFWG